MTSPVDDPNAQRWLALSSLCDGEASPDEAEASFVRWRDDAEVRARWHSYQWIGDVMRSEDLASDMGHDQAFLLALRARLADEPVVLAPQRPAGLPAQGIAAPQQMPVAAGGARRQRWTAPVAMAAGVMVVAGALVVMRGTTALTEPLGTGPVAIGGEPAPLRVVANGAQPSVGAVPASAPALGDMLRNPELDRYLAAHRQFAQSPALTTPGGVRHVAVTPEGR